MKRLLLINPVGRRSGFLLSKFTTFPPLGLAYVAAVTPSDWDIKILDENFDDFVYEDADIVGITAFTSNITRAYEIARIYRDRNVKVVMGGIHVSMLPDEALQYADAVVIGEAEAVWGKVLEDFENGCLRDRYEGSQISLKDFKVRPRRDLLHPGYIWHPILTSRGCPFDCHFCSVSKYLGTNYRQRDAQDVLDELQDLHGKDIFFVDDNLIGYSVESRGRAKEIFEGMIARRMKKKWWMQTSMNAAEDESILRLAGRAGCQFALIGFESINGSMLKEMKKGINLKIGVENFCSVIKTFHASGIAVLGSFILGNDQESLEYYKELAAFLVGSGIDILQVSILTPLPGTRLFQDLEERGKLIYTNFPEDWNKYRFSYMVHVPRETGIDNVYIGNNHIKSKFYSFKEYSLRIIRSMIEMKSPYKTYCIYKMNQSFKTSWAHSHYKNKFPLHID